MRKLAISETDDLLTKFIKTTVKSAGFSRIVIAVSGGVDSATSVSLAVKTLGKNNVYALLLPYGNWHDEAKKHAQKLLAGLKIPNNHIIEVDIAPMVDALIKALSVKREAKSKDQIRLGNMMARMRMIVLFDFAKNLNALVLGTENKTEHLLGYFTRFGDEASDIEPLRNIYKTEVYELATHLEVPVEIIQKAPTAGLWQGQTDEGEFGFTYKEADEILFGLSEAKMSEKELVKQGYSPQTITRIKKWVAKIDFKHHLPHIAPEPVLR